MIIFTHNLPFYFELLEAAQEISVTIQTHWMLRSNPAACGVVAANDAPWEVKKVKERISSLRQFLSAMPVQNLVPEPEYRASLKQFYGLLRETWERLVEERLLSGVVGRFEPGVKTQSLKGVLVEDSDYQKVYTAMTKVSRYSGHDMASSFQTSFPTRQEIEQDLRTLTDYEAMLRTRSADVERRRKALEDAPQTLAS